MIFPFAAQVHGEVTGLELDDVTELLRFSLKAFGFLQPREYAGQQGRVGSLG